MLEFFRALLEIDNTEIEDSSAVGLALDWYALGADFADALHLAVCGPAVMHTFDKGFCKTAREAGITPPIGSVAYYGDFTPVNSRVPRCSIQANCFQCTQ
ncbi:MAG: hypothetical protein WAW61_15925 [Methylococcaceae bacterium]